MTELVAGLVLGVAGSVHCITMCGPLLLALHRGPSAPMNTSSSRETEPARPWRVPPAVLHHTGRLTAYTMAGLAAGLAGHVVSAMGLGRALALVTGGVLLVSAVRRSGMIATSRGAGAVGRALVRALAAARTRLGTDPITGRVLVGALNGLLPCGLVYAALTAAAGLGSAPRAAAFMLLFGVGTLPALSLLSVATDRIPVAVRARLRVATPITIALVGMLLIGRGLSMPSSHAHHSPTVHQH